jgi:hypothetical protein
MTQALDAFDERSSEIGVPITAAESRSTAALADTSTSGTFAFTFSIAGALLYTVFERLNWPLFTYHPVSGKLEFGKVMAGVGPPMFWYGWLALSGISALVVAWIATKAPREWLVRGTVFCCALAALWPIALESLRYFIVKVATFDADFLNSVWVAAIPAFVAAGAITYFVPSRVADRLWANWLWIVPIGGLAVLGYSLQQYFIR